MGLDGGTYITRSDVLRGQSWAVAQQDTSRSTRGGSVSTSGRKQSEADQQSTRATRWSTCTLSSQPLQEPVVADYLGFLYNREAVLEFLLMRNGILVDDNSQHRYANQLRQAGAAVEHLKTKRDVFTVHCKPSPSNSLKHGGDTSPAVYECPIHHVRCDRQPFSALSTCGHVFSDRAIQQFGVEDIVVINGTPEAVAALRQRIGQHRTHSKSKKRQRLHESQPAQLVQPLLQLTAGPDA